MSFNKKTHSILLIYTGYSDGITLEDEAQVIQLGLLYLGTVLKEKGFKVKLLTTYYTDVDDIKRIIEKEKIVITGFYTTTENIYRCLLCASMIKKICPNQLVILGGPHASIMDTEILNKNDSVDLIVRKEGERTLLHVAEFYFENYGTLEDIKGITYRKDKKIFKNPDAPFIKDLDKLPLPDRDLLTEPLRSFDITYPRLITGRGCPFSCAFCYEGYSGNKYRMRSAQNVLSEIDYLFKRGEVRYIRFMDDTFTVNPSRTIKICRGLRERLKEGKKFGWFCEGRVDILARHPNLIYEMSLSGLVNLHIGVECAVQKILDIYQKKITPEEIEKVVKTCVDAQIPLISMNFILGGPMESEETYKENIEFIKKLIKIAPGRLQITSALLIPFPGTRIAGEPEKFGLTIIDSELKTGITNETPYCETEFLNKYDLIRLKRRFDDEVNKIMIENLPSVPPELLEEHFSLQFYGIQSYWRYLLSYDIGIRRFFNWKLHNRLYFYLKEINEKDILNFYPARTYNLNYNDKNLILLERISGHVILEQEDSRLYELSSGKMNFAEILHIAKEKIFKNLSSEEIYKKVMDFYIRMEKFHAVIFAKI